VVKIVLSLIMISLLLLSLAVVVLHGEKPTVVATTTVLASIVEDLAGDKVVVEYISLPSLCPAHYDVKPSDAEKIKYASIVLSHGIEPWIDKLVNASGSRAQVFKGVCTSWSTPEDLRKCYVEVADILKKYLGVPVDEGLNKSLNTIDYIASWLRDFSKENGFIGTPVVVMRWQRSFINYLGFNIVASFGPPETVTLKEYSEIITNATKAHALLVIDNLPSGVDLGMKIAREVGAIEVAIHNFPKAAPEIRNVTDMWVYNVKLISNALKTANTTKTIEALSTQVSELKRGNDLLTMYLSISVITNAILLVGLIVAIVKLRGVKK